jgi:phosphoglycerate dehydrogenase-like enzyme
MKILISIHSPFVMWTIPRTHVARLRAQFPQHEFLHATDNESALALIPDADVAFSSVVNRAQFEAAARLRWIHSPAAGIGGMLFPELVASPVVMTNARGVSGDTIAEHVLAVTLAMFRRLPHAFRSQAAREWAQNAISLEGNRQIAGSRVLIVGLGAIGRAVARRMTLLGAHVVALRKRVDQSVDGVSDVASILASIGRLHEFLPTADVVVIAAPHTHETRNLIGRPELALMKREALLVNVSRGQLVDEEALLDALRRESIGGAALDVFVDEPLPPESPFWSLPNLLITPHTSGFRPDHWDISIELFGENLRRFERGDELLNVVDKEAGY